MAGPSSTASIRPNTGTLCFALRLPSTGSTRTSGYGAPKVRRPDSSDRTENASPRSANASSSAKTTASAARSTSIVVSPPAPTSNCTRPASVPAIGSTAPRTPAPMRRNNSIQSTGFKLRPARARPVSGQAGVGRHFSPSATAALDDDRDEIGLLHRPHALDELRHRHAVGPVDAEQDQGLCHGIGQLCLVVEVQLLQRFEDVVQPSQTPPPILIGPVEHR